ncbi:AAA family ATPase [Vibrio sp. 404]|uniref:AAA family ATPase n=1 Tax=Vibrio marinisediminis TaxID=2758441 RepID=A0A7W2FTC2_9VIBR|nr:AAA family ATPase [Vibrio marinisediminis]MBA5763886.1 AAA family ATPase [Vibrio marinisediminis]
MYNHHFGFVELPFSIVPNSRFLYLSQRHKEAIHHLQAGLGDGGGFAMLTGEVGTGKTTVSKAMIKALDSSTQIGSILNPTFSNIELLQVICDEFSLLYSDQASVKQLTDVIKQFLLESYRSGKQTLVIIDEAQHLSAEVLEQLRLLTNLETEQRKLLKVLLIGQPELQHKLQMPQLRQLAQRITGRYHLLPLDSNETAKYIQFRLQLAGGNSELFSSKSLKAIAQATQGIPRLVNLVCDAALKRAYQIGEKTPSSQTVSTACEEVMSFQPSFYQPRTSAKPNSNKRSYVIAAMVGLTFAGAAYHYLPTVVTPHIQHQVERLYPAQPNRVEGQQTLPRELMILLEEPSSLSQGLETLYQVWGYHASVVDQMCLENNRSQFNCAQLQGSLQQILESNLPVLLTLNYQGQNHYAVLYRANQQQVQLLIDGQRVEFATQWLEQVWSGEYHLIWQRLWHQTLKPGMSGHPVASLDYQLSQLLQMPLGSEQSYGDDLIQKVSLFQRWQQLAVDGIAGEETLHRLELLSQEGAPHLNALEGV